MTEDRQNGFSFQLQRFADGGTDGGTEGQESGGKAPADASAGQEGDKPADESPKADEAAVQRRIDEALASAKVKWEKDYKRKAEAAKKEAERHRGGDVEPHAGDPYDSIGMFAGCAYRIEADT